jgi:hypothetical protein
MLFTPGSGLSTPEGLRHAAIDGGPLGCDLNGGRTLFG